MDQAIELLAVAGQAKLIEFNPLVAHDTKLPDGSVFVIANSLQVRRSYSSKFKVPCLPSPTEFQRGGGVVVHLENKLFCQNLI